jgi:predicted Na+-dependent transporter
VPLGQLQVTHWVTRRHGIGITTNNDGLRLLRGYLSSISSLSVRTGGSSNCLPKWINQEIVTYLLCVASIFITGCTLSTKALVENCSRWSLHIFAQGKYFLIALFSIMSTTATQFYGSGGLLIGLVLTSCVLIMISSNISSQEGPYGNDALMVVQFTTGDLSGPFITPLLTRPCMILRAWYYITFCCLYCV